MKREIPECLVAGLEVLITDFVRASPQLPRLGYSPGLPCQVRKFCSSVEFPVRTLPYPPQYWFSAVARKNGAGIAFVSSPFPQDRKSTSELQSLMRTSYAVFCLKNKIWCSSNIDHTQAVHTLLH